MQDSRVADLSVFEGLQATANAAMGFGGGGRMTQMSVFNSPKSLVQEVESATKALAEALQEDPDGNSYEYGKAWSGIVKALVKEYGNMCELDEISSSSDHEFLVLPLVNSIFEKYRIPKDVLHDIRETAYKEGKRAGNPAGKYHPNDPRCPGPITGEENGEWKVMTTQEKVARR